jgi:hypothetical protein
MVWSSLWSGSSYHAIFCYLFYVLLLLLCLFRSWIFCTVSLKISNIPSEYTYIYVNHRKGQSNDSFKMHRNKSLSHVWFQIKMSKKSNTADFLKWFSQNKIEITLEHFSLRWNEFLHTILFLHIYKMNMRKYVERDDFLMKECNLYYNVTIIIMHIFSITWLRFLVTSDFLRLSSLMLCPQLVC